ncbi:MAG: hypothetical protein PVG38_17090 [Gammaproteobacteria bacterium]|jgi:hypothetical protein
MLDPLHQDLISWAGTLDRIAHGSYLSYPHRSTNAAAMDSMGRSGIYGPRVPSLDGRRYFVLLSRAIGRLPGEQQQFLQKVYIARELKARQPGHTHTWCYRRLHRLHVSLADLLRE